MVHFQTVMEWRFTLGPTVTVDDHTRFHYSESQIGGD